MRKRHSSSDTKQEISENMDINDKKTPDPKTLKNLINIQEGDSTVIAVGDHNSLINDNVGYTNSSATVSCQTTPQATVQRESSLKRKLILALSSTKNALMPACLGHRT